VFLSRRNTAGSMPALRPHKKIKAGKEREFLAKCRPIKKMGICFL